MNDKKKYVAPSLKLSTYCVEVGFANSLTINTLDNSTYTNGLEDWTWNQGGGSGNGFNEGTDNGGSGTGWDWDII